MKEQIIAYYALHNNGTAVPVYSHPTQAQSARQTAISQGKPIICPGEPMPAGIKVIDTKKLNRNQRRLLKKLQGLK